MVVIQDVSTVNSSVRVTFAANVDNVDSTNMYSYLVTIMNGTTPTTQYISAQPDTRIYEVTLNNAELPDSVSVGIEDTNGSIVDTTSVTVSSPMYRYVPSAITIAYTYVGSRLTVTWTTANPTADASANVLYSINTEYSENDDINSVNNAYGTPYVLTTTEYPIRITVSALLNGSLSTDTIGSVDTTPLTTVSEVTQAVTGPGYRLNAGTITLVENITVSDPAFLSVLPAGTIFDGSGYTITVTNPAWSGLFSTAVTVKNLTIDSSGGALLDNAGWFFASGIGGIAYACTNNAPVTGQNTGGIFGGLSNGLALSCTNNGDVMTNGNGGIFGKESTGKAVGCLNTGDIGAACGGIFGIGSIGTAINCGNTGYIRHLDEQNNILRSGGIFGYGQYQNDVTAIAINCYSSGASDSGAAGIFGAFYYSSSSAINCYSTTGNIHGPDIYDLQMTNCYASTIWDNEQANAATADVSNNALVGTDGSVWDTSSSPYTLSTFRTDYECVKALYPQSNDLSLVFTLAKNLGIPERVIAFAIAIKARDDTTLNTVMSTIVQGATYSYTAGEAASLYALMTGIDTTKGLTLIVPVSADDGYDP